MDQVGLKKKSSPVMKKPPNTHASIQNKIFPKLSDESSKPLNYQNFLGKETKEGSERTPTAVHEEKPIPEKVQKESVLEQTAELDHANNTAQDKTNPEKTDGNDHHDHPPASDVKTSTKTKLANLKFKLNDLKRNESLGDKFSNTSGHGPKNMSEKENSVGRISPFGHKVQTQGSLPFGNHGSSEKNLMEEPMSADGRRPHLSLAESRDHSGHKEGSDVALLGRTGISRMVGNMIARKSRKSLS